MVRKDTISIIIPVYNVESYLRKCLDSVLDQTYKDIEIILINDASTDQSASICREYAQRDKRIRFINKGINTGLADTRNMGIENAMGEYIVFLDSDDWLEREFLERLIVQAKSDGSDLVFASYYSFNEQKSAFYSYQDLFTPGIVSIEDYLQYRCTGQQDILYTAWGKLYHHSLFTGQNGIRFPKGRMHEDAVAVPRLFMKSQQISYVAEALYCYRKRQGSITNGNITLKQIQDNLYLTEQFILDMVLANKIRRETYLISYKAVCFICKRQMEEAGFVEDVLYKEVQTRLSMFS